MYIIRKKKPTPGEHPYIPELKHLYQQRRISRREFLQNATMLGLSLASASTFLAACSSGEDATATSPPKPTEPPAATAVPATATAVPATATATAAVAGPKRGGEVISIHDVQDLVDPHAAQWMQFDILMNVAEYLIDLSPDNVLVPTLLEKWEASEDVKTWTLYVRQGVNFNHGPELTADDVVWNIQRWLDPEVGCPLTATLANYVTPNDIEKVDDYTVKVHCNQPYAGLIPQISGGSYAAHVLPKDWEGDFYEQPYGTGPFTLEEFALDELCVLKRREDYWLNGVDGKPLPYLDSIRYVYLGGEEASETAALKTGQADVSTLSASQAKTLEGTDVVVEPVPSGGCSVYKMRSDEVGAFHDNRLRQAVKACQDREQIRDAVWGSYGGPLGQDHHVGPVYPDYCPVDTPPRDIEKAKALLAEAGYPDGWDIVMQVNDSQTYRTMSQLLKDQCAPAGINIELEVMPSSLYWDQWTEQDFSVVPWGHRPWPVMILETMYRCGAAWNDSHWCDEEFEELLTRAGATVEVDARREIMCDIETLMQERGPTGIPVWSSTIYAHRPRVKDFQGTPNVSEFYKVAWLDDET